MSKKPQLLMEFLETLDADKIVAIGARKGNGFIYIGKAGDTQMIKRAFVDQLANAMNQRDEYERKLKSLILTSVVLGDDEEVNKELIRNRAFEIHRKYDSLMKSERYLKIFKPETEREVEESYDRTTDDALVIIIDGVDCGRFWTKDEFDRKYWF